MQFSFRLPRLLVTVFYSKWPASRGRTVRKINMSVRSRGALRDFHWRRNLIGWTA